MVTPMEIYPLLKDRSHYSQKRSTEVNHVYDPRYERAGTERYRMWKDGGSKVGL